VAHAAPGQPVDGRDDQGFDFLVDDGVDPSFEVATPDILATADAVIGETRNRASPSAHGGVPLDG